MKQFIFLLLLWPALHSSLVAQKVFTQTVRGLVIDEQSGYPLVGATVSTEYGSHTLSANDGTFVLTGIAVGRVDIMASFAGYEIATLSNVEVTSAKEVVIEIRLREKVQQLNEITIKGGKSKLKSVNEAAVVSARQLSVDEAFRYAGTRNDPSRMAQNFAGVSGTNDGRNDIIVRGNSPTGVLWRMDGIDIPNPNHFSTMGATGGPVSMLNINTLKNSDFITSAFPAAYGNAVGAVFDLRMRNGNTQKREYTGQMGFNGFEFGAEGPFSKKSKASYLINYRYSLVAALQNLGLNFGTGAATPYFQDASFKINLPTKKAGTFSLFGIGGASHIHFLPASQDPENLYATNDGTERDRKFRSRTGVLGLSHQYFFNTNTSVKTTLAIAGFSARYHEDIVETDKPMQRAFLRNSDQYRYAINHTLNKKFNASNQLTAGLMADVSRLKLKQDYIKDGDSVLRPLLNTNATATLLRGFVSFYHRFNNRLSTNVGLYAQTFSTNNSTAAEPRFNIKYQLKTNQSLSFGAGLHSQLQPLEVYFYETKNEQGQTIFTNKNLDFVKSWHGALAYDVTVNRHLRIKAELYGQYIFDAAVETVPSSFSMLNAGSDFGFPDKTNLVNNGNGHNYGIELTAERFLHKGLYYLFTVSLFQSKYSGSDKVWRNTAFNSNYVVNALAGKEFKLNSKTSFGIDTKLTVTGGQRFTAFDVPASQQAGYIIYQEGNAFGQQHPIYMRLDLKFSYTRNLKKVTQKWYIDLQNLTNRANIYIRTLNPKTGVESQINQIGFFPNINYLITF
jgi:hypothetical protein